MFFSSVGYIVMGAYLAGTLIKTRNKRMAQRVLGEATMCVLLIDTVITIAAFAAGYLL